MNSNKLKFWIKERHNRQTGTYFVAMGLGKKPQGKSSYGSNIYHSYSTEAEYAEAVKTLRETGASIQ